MRRGRLALLAVAAALAAGCQEETSPAPLSCTGEPDTILAALDGAPGEVRLTDGATLSGCVRLARTDADLQNVGVTFSNAAEDLEVDALKGDEQAALRLGYLVGAARKGAETSSGVGAELVRRLERSAALDGATSPDAAASLQRGLEAGEARG